MSAQESNVTSLAGSHPDTADPLVRAEAAMSAAIDEFRHRDDDNAHIAAELIEAREDLRSENRRQHTALDSGRSALAMLGTVFPHIRQGIDQGRRPATMPLLIEAKAVADLIQLANRDQENQEEMPDGAIADATYLLTRMLNAAILVEGGDFDGKGRPR